MTRMWYLVVAVILSGCGHSIVMFKDTEELTSVPTSSQTISFFVGGLLPTNVELTSAQLCGEHQKLQQVDLYYSGPDVLLTALTLNMYSPKTLNVWCE